MRQRVYPADVVDEMGRRYEKVLAITTDGVTEVYERGPSGSPVHAATLNNAHVTPSRFPGACCGDKLVSYAL